VSSLAFTIAAAALLTWTTALHAQRPEPDSVPIEFLRMLWLSPVMSGDEAEVAVGRLPDRLATELRPLADARVVGSMISRRFSVSAMVLPGQRAEVHERVLARLIEAGWTRRPEPARRSGGFEMAERGRETPVSLCSPDDHNLQLTADRHAGDSTVVSLVLVSGMVSSCGDPELTPRPPYREAPIPALQAPAGSRHGGGGSGGSAWESYTAARLSTDMTPAALIAHYAAQLLAQGWRAGVQAESNDVAIQVFRMTDANRVAWQSVLYVTLLPNGQRELYLRVTRDR
jgi:hypothetical protein